MKFLSFSLLAFFLTLCVTPLKAQKFAWTKTVNPNNTGLIPLSEFYGEDLVRDQEGNFYVLGGFREQMSFDGIQIFVNSQTCDSNVNKTDIFLAKFNEEGEFMWVKHEAGGCSEYPRSLTIDSEGNVYVVATFGRDMTLSNGDEIPIIQPGLGSSENSTRILMIKYNKDGDILWYKTSTTTVNHYIDYNYPMKVVVDNEDNIYLLTAYRGYIIWEGMESGILDIFPVPEGYIVSKFDKNGQVSWHKNFTMRKDIGSAATNIASYKADLVTDNEGNCYFSGRSSRYFISEGDTLINFGPRPSGQNFDGGYNFFLMKLKGDDGSVLMTKKADDWSNVETGVGLAIDSNGDCYVLSNCLGLISFDGLSLPPLGFFNTRNTFLAKFDKNTGNTLLLKGYPDNASSNSRTYKIAIDAQDNLYAFGEFRTTTKLGEHLLISNDPSGINPYSYVMKLNSQGEVTWAIQHINPITGQGNIIVDEDSNIYINGIFRSNPIFGCDTLSSVIGKPFLSKIIQEPQNISLAEGENVNLCTDSFDSIIRVNPVPGATKYGWAFIEPTPIIVNSAFTNTNGTSVNVLANAPLGEYELQVIAYNDCFDVLGKGTIQLTVLPKPVFANPSQNSIYVPDTMCQNTTNILIRVDPMIHTDAYHWTLPSGVVATNGSNITTEPEIRVNFLSAMNSGLLSVRGYNNACGFGRTTSKFIRVFGTLPSFEITGPSEVCLGEQSVIFQVPPPLIYQPFEWELPQGIEVVYGANDPRIEVNITSQAQSGTIRARAVNPCYQGEYSSFELKVNQNPVKPESIQGLSAVCVGQSGVTYTISEIPDATEYIWTLPQGYLPVSGSNITTTNSIELDFSPEAQTGIIKVRGNNICAMGEDSDGFTIQIDTPSMPAGIISGLSGICEGQSNVSYSIVPIPNANQYLWNLPIGVSPSDGSAITNTNSISLNFDAAFTGGEISVSGQNGCGEGEASPSFSIQVTQPPSPIGVILGNSSPCQGTVSSFSIPIVANANEYEWILPNGIIPVGGSNITNSPEITLRFNSPINGVIQVKPKNNCFEGVLSQPFQFQVIPTLPKPDRIQGLEKLCINTRNVNYSVPNMTEGVEFIWTLPNGVILVSGQSSAQVIVDFTSSAQSGYISVKAKNQCFESENTQLWIDIEQDKPVKPVIVLECDKLLAEDNLANYQWYKDGEIILEASGATYQILSPGTYFLRTSNTCGFTDSDDVLFERNECKTSLELPTAFSPNGDGLNDELDIFGQNFTNLKLTIYNRWGQIVFISYRKEDKWNGTYEGKDTPNDVYVWKAEYDSVIDGQRVQKIGKVTLIR